DSLISLLPATRNCRGNFAPRRLLKEHTQRRTSENGISIFQCRCHDQRVDAGASPGSRAHEYDTVQISISNSIEEKPRRRTLADGFVLVNLVGRRFRAESDTKT